MYKVFIENRPVIIAEKNIFSDHTILLFAERVKSIEKEIHPLIKKSEVDIPIILLSKDPDSDFERLFSGYKRVDAAGGIVRKDDEYLFIKRNGKWDIPKGKLNKKEEIEVCAVREIEEECGITGPVIDHFICCTYHSYKYKEKPTLKRTFWYAMTYTGDEILEPQLEEGITKVKWFAIDKLAKIRNNTFVSIVDVMDHYFDPSAYLKEDFSYPDAHFQTED